MLFLFIYLLNLCFLVINVAVEKNKINFHVKNNNYRQYFTLFKKNCITIYWWWNYL